MKLKIGLGAELGKYLSNSQNCVKAVIAFVCKSCKWQCNWQLLFAKLQLTSFIGTITIYMHLSISSFLYIPLELTFLPSSALFQMTFRLCTISKFAVYIVFELVITINNCNRLFLYAICNWRLLKGLLHLLTSVFTFYTLL